MLEHFFHWPPQIARLRNNPGVELLDAFAEHLTRSFAMVDAGPKGEE